MPPMKSEYAIKDVKNNSLFLMNYATSGMHPNIFEPMWIWFQNVPGLSALNSKN